MTWGRSSTAPMALGGRSLRCSVLTFNCRPLVQSLTCMVRLRVLRAEWVSSCTIYFWFHCVAQRGCLSVQEPGSATLGALWECLTLALNALHLPSAPSGPHWPTRDPQLPSVSVLRLRHPIKHPVAFLRFFSLLQDRFFFFPNNSKLIPS